MIESSYLAEKRLVQYRTIFLETISIDDRKNSRDICESDFKDPYVEFYFDNVDGIVGYCDGIVCIYVLGHIYLISSVGGWSGELPINVGFGRDNISGDYKIILMYFFERILGNILVKTEVLNLDDGERKCICSPILYDQLCDDKASTYANGSLFWLNKRKKNAAALDLNTEIFREVVLPSCFTEYSDDSISECGRMEFGARRSECEVEKILSINISGILDVNFWKLGLGACYFRPRGKQPSKSPLAQVPFDQYWNHIVHGGLGLFFDPYS
ncbi:hypothetical protein EUTSA_v10017914mg [Eutrema salsugineum]|uniref:F-box associated domain-containing protein n=1 Tax=Eutrema salsugineum TaxID=72664 RepID=V4LP55_EUTSA|nr:hypothetical protein EUTSA_v10017914mg [Eutrema salsugineum]